MMEYLNIALASLRFWWLKLLLKVLHVSPPWDISIEHLAHTDMSFPFEAYQNRLVLVHLLSFRKALAGVFGHCQSTEIRSSTHIWTLRHEKNLDSVGLLYGNAFFLFRTIGHGA